MPTVRDALHLAPHGCNFPMVAPLFMMGDIWWWWWWWCLTRRIAVTVGRDDARRKEIKKETDKREREGE